MLFRFLILSSVFAFANGAFSLAKPKPRTDPKPAVGWDELKEKMVLNSAMLDSQLNEVGLVLVKYEATVSRKGILQKLIALDSAPLNGNCNAYLMQSLKSTAWIPGTYSEKNTTMTFSFVFAFQRKSEKLDSVIRALSGQRDTLVKHGSDSMKSWPPSNYVAFAMPGHEAHYPGGEQGLIDFVVSEFNYPPRCMELGVDGYVIVRFKITQYGEVFGVYLEQTIMTCPELGEEAIRVIKSTGFWIPTVYKGHYISAFRQVPLSLQVE